MVLPSKIPVNSRIVYDATKAVFRLWKETPDIGTLRMPAFGTGFGQVPGSIAASQTLQAFCDEFLKQEISPDSYCMYRW